MCIVLCVTVGNDDSRHLPVSGDHGSCRVRITFSAVTQESNAAMTISATELAGECRGGRNGLAPGLSAYPLHFSLLFEGLFITREALLFFLSPQGSVQSNCFPCSSIYVKSPEI